MFVVFALHGASCPRQLHLNTSEPNSLNYLLDQIALMFGALNRFIGRLDGEPIQQPRNGPSDNAFGFQVLRNKDPELPLEPWFDFIVGINGHPIVCS